MWSNLSPTLASILAPDNKTVQLSLFLLEAIDTCSPRWMAKLTLLMSTSKGHVPNANQTNNEKNLTHSTLTPIIISRTSNNSSRLNWPSRLSSIRSNRNRIWNLHQRFTSFYQLLPASTSFYQLLPDFTSLYQLIPAFTNFTSFYQL